MDSPGFFESRVFLAFKPMRAVFFLVSIILTGCIVQFQVSDYYESASTEGEIGTYYVPYDSLAVERQLRGERAWGDTFKVMEVTADDLKRSFQGRDVWYSPVNPGCGNVFGPSGIVSKFNALADTSDAIVIPLSINYQRLPLEILYDSLTFDAPAFVVKHHAYEHLSSIRRPNWHVLLEELTGQKLPKGLSKLFVRSDGATFYLDYDGEYHPLP